MRRRVFIVEIALKLFVIVVLMRIAYVDFINRIIHDEWTLLLLIAGIVESFRFSEIALWQHILGIFAVSVPLFFVACIAPGSIGGGDIKLMAAGGLLMGIRNIWQAFETGILACGIVVMIFLLVGKLERNSEIALGPFLCLGMLKVWLNV